MSGNHIIVDPVSNSILSWDIDLVSIINHPTDIELEPPTVKGQEMPGPLSSKRARGESIGEATINAKKSKMVSAETSSATGIRDMQKQVPQHYTLTMASKNYYRGKFILELPYLTTEKKLNLTDAAYEHCLHLLMQPLPTGNPNAPTRDKITMLVSLTD